MSKKQKYKYPSIAMWPFMMSPFRYGIVFNEQELADFCDRNKLQFPTDIPEQAHAVTIPYPQENLSLVYLIGDEDFHPDPIQLVALLAHESMHVFQMMMRYMREEQPGVEIEAYGIQIILQNFLYAYKDRYHA